jgi:hypothetical protein
MRVRRYCAICRTAGPWTETTGDNWHREILAQNAAHDQQFHPVVEPVQVADCRSSRLARIAA